jgi:hypothetical protein
MAVWPSASRNIDLPVPTGRPRGHRPTGGCARRAVWSLCCGVLGFVGVLLAVPQASSDCLAVWASRDCRVVFKVSWRRRRGSGER